MPNIQLLNMCCLEFMKDIPDKHFELAICDPPYNVGASDGNFGGKSDAPSRISGKLNGKHYANHNKTPDEIYFSELFRVSKNQIVWGMNYYPQHFYHSGAIIWDKLTTGPLSDCEIAFQSFNKLVVKYTCAWTGFNKGKETEANKYRVHPNQKPVALYRWLLKNYAQEGDKILDTHLGSGSSAIAAFQMGFDFTGTEIDVQYYEAAQKRFKLVTPQTVLF